MDAQFLTIAGFASACGLSESTVRRRIADGSLPACQPGGEGSRWLIPRAALDQLRRSCERTEPAIPPSPPPASPQRPALAGPRPRWMLGKEATP